MPELADPLNLALVVATAGVAYLDLEHKATGPAPRPRDPDPAGRPIARKLRETFRRQLARVLGGLPDVPTAPLPERFDLTPWDKPLATAMTPLIRPYWDAGGKKLRAAVGLDPAEWRVTDPHLREMIETAAFDFAHSTNETTSLELTAAKDRLRAELAEGVVEKGETTRELTKRVKTVFTRASTYRAQRIAFTEAMRATNVSSLESAKQSKVVRSKRLLLSSDACSYCQSVKAREPEGGWPLDDPMDDDGKGTTYSVAPCPPLHPHCACSITYEIDEESLGIDLELPPVVGIEPEAAPAPEPEPEPAPPPEPVDPLARMKARVNERLDELASEQVAADAEVARHKAEMDRIRAAGGDHQPARAAWLQAMDRLSDVREQHKRLAQWEDLRKTQPGLIPALPMKERLALYTEGDRKVAAIRDAVRPIQERKAELLVERTTILPRLVDLLGQERTVDNALLRARGKSKVRLQERQKEIRAELDPLEARRDALRAEEEAIGDRIRKAVADTIAVDRPVGIRWDHGALTTHDGYPLNELTPENKAKADAASDWLSRITREGEGGDIKRKIGQRDKQRPYHARDHIAIKTDEDGDMIVHELGHAIEESVKLGGDKTGRRSKEFLEYRVGGEALVKMKDAVGSGSSYRDDELGRKDEFDKLFDEYPGRAYYVGKEYTSGATEIVSMGVQQLWNDAHKFVDRDPEYLKYILGVLSGELR